MSGQAWLLVTTGDSAGLAEPLNAMFDLGVHGESVRLVSVPGASAEILASATAASAEAARLLYREQYLNRNLVVRFVANGLGNAYGRSAELAFALALTTSVVRRPIPALAATGQIDEGGAVRPVEGVAQKYLAAAQVLPKGGLFIYPGANANVLTSELRDDAAKRGIKLVPAFNLEAVLAGVGLPIRYTMLTNPFRGLEPFGYAHASVFFGRGPEISGLADLLARERAVLVSGPSGAGKSSLVLAGLLPELIRRRQGGENIAWGLLRPRAVAVAPEPAQEREALARTLVKAWCHSEEGGLGESAIAGTLPSPDAVGLAAWLRVRHVRQPILVIDQLEELFDAPLHAPTFQAFADLIADLPAHGIAVVATIVNDALPRLQALPRLEACFAEGGRYAVTSRLGATLLEQVIRGPATAARLMFEHGLEATLLAEASDAERHGADVLPLLELLLSSLYDLRDPASNELLWDAYHQLGGLNGVIDRRAKAVYDALPVDQQAEVPLLLWLLSTAGQVETEVIAQDHPLHGLLWAMQSHRLLVRDSEGIVRAAHESLLRNWDTAVEFRRANEDDVGLWHDLVREALQFESGERALIPAGPQLEAAAALLSRREGLWTTTEARTCDYVIRSRRAVQRRRLLVSVAAGITLPTALGWGGWQTWQSLHPNRDRHIGFDDLVGQFEGGRIPAAPYLLRLGIRIGEVEPATTKLVVVNTQQQYEGLAVDPSGGLNVLTQELDGTASPIQFTLHFDEPPIRVGLQRAGLWTATSSGVSHPAWQMEAFDRGGKPLGTTNEDLLRAVTTASGKTLFLDENNRLVAGPESRPLTDKARIIERDKEASEAAAAGQVAADKVWYDKEAGSVRQFRRFARRVPSMVFVVDGKGTPIASVRIASDYRLNGKPFAGFHAVLIKALILSYS